MSRYPRIVAQLLCVVLMSLGTMGGVHAATTDPASDPLRLVIVLTRHGVRSPNAEPGSLDRFAAAPWPTWPVAPGYLTPHGKQLMSMMGGWYRLYYAQQGLLSATGCPAAGTLAITADDEERTIESAHGLLDGFAAHCDIRLDTAPKKGADALFGHDFSGLSDADRAQATAAVLGRIGNDPQRLVATNLSQLEGLQRILLACGDQPCSDAQKAGKQLLLEQPSAIKAGSGDGLVSIKSPLHNASTFAENIFFEYVEGMPMSKVGWGRVSPQQVGELLQLHSTYSDISLRTPAVASAYAGKLGEHIAATLQQAASATATAGAVAPASARMVFLVGHDTNIETLAGLLNLHWMLPEQPADPTFTGGALVFELRQHKGSGRYTVRAFYVSQSMQQMRDSTPLDLTHSPQRSPIFIPGCSSAAVGYDCPLEAFVELVKHSANTQRDGSTAGAPPKR